MSATLKNLTTGEFRQVEEDSAEYNRLIAIKDAGGIHPLWEEQNAAIAGGNAGENIKTLTATLAAAAAGSDVVAVLGEAPFAGRVVGVKYIPVTVLTGANTDSRTHTVVNKGQAGAGSTNIATLAYVSGVNAAAFDEKLETLNATAANLLVAAGDVLEFLSTHVGSTGIAEPGGRVEIQIAEGVS